MLAAVAAIAIVGLVVPVLLTRANGAMGIPRNDDWSYLRTLFQWVETGELDFNNWVSMTLITQLVIAAPIVWLFGAAITLIQLETAVLGFVGLCLVAWLAYNVTRRLWIATFTALLVAAGPLWGPLAVSYMTDVPTFAVSMLALALGVHAIRRSPVSMPFLVASMTVGVLGFTIRQYAAVPPIAITLIGAHLLWQETPRSRARFRTLAVAAVVLLVTAVVFWLFWRTIDHPKAFSPTVPNGHAVRATFYKGTALLRLLGLLVLPAILVAGPGKIVRRSWSVARDTTVFVAIGVPALLGFTGIAAPRIGFAGNYIAPDGILSQSVADGHRPDIFPPGVFNILLVVGTIAATLLALALLPTLHDMPRRVRMRHAAPRDAVTAFLALTVAGYVAAYLLASITDIPMYDRYVLPMVPLVAVLLLRPIEDQLPDPHPHPAARITSGLVALVMLAFVGTVYTIDSAAFDGTRWKVASEAVRAGWSREQVRGGFEWANYHAGVRVSQQKPFCVRVVVNPTFDETDPRIIAYGFYRSPLQPDVLVAAIRTRTPCTPRRAPADP